MIRLALLLAFAAAPALAQSAASRIDAPYPVPASLAPEDLAAALGGVCEAAPCVEIVDHPRVLRDEALAVTAVATPPGGPRVVARAWVPGALPEEKRPDRIVPATATERLWNGARRWDWSVFGQHAAYVEAAPGRSLEVAAAASRDAVDAALAAADVDALREAPPATAYVVPRSKQVFWSEAAAAEAAAAERPRYVALVPADRLATLLPQTEETGGAKIESGSARYAPYPQTPDDPVTPTTYAHLIVPGGRGTGRGGAAEFSVYSRDPDAAPAEPISATDYRTRRTTLRGYPALVTEGLAPDGTALPPYTEGSFPPTLLQLGGGREVSVGGTDSLLVVRLLDAFDVDALRSAPARPMPFAQSGPYGRGAGTAYVGAYEAPGRAGVVRAASGRGVEAEFVLPPGAFASSPGAVGGCLGANPEALEYATTVEAAFVLVTPRPVAPCAGVGAPDYPASPAAELAREGGFVLLQDHGPSDALPLAWVETWPALRHGLLPAWAFPLAPAGPPERRAAGPYDVLAAPFTTDGGRVPGAPFAAEALFFEAGGHLLSVVAAAATPAAARAQAAAFAASLQPFSAN